METGIFTKFVRFLSGYKKKDPPSFVSSLLLNVLGAGDGYWLLWIILGCAALSVLLVAVSWHLMKGTKKISKVKRLSLNQLVWTLFHARLKKICIRGDPFEIDLSDDHGLDKCFVQYWKISTENDYITLARPSKKDLEKIYLNQLMNNLQKWENSLDGVTEQEDDDSDF